MFLFFNFKLMKQKNMKKLSITIICLFFLINVFAQSYVTLNTQQTITANKNFSGTYYGFGIYSTQWYSESIKARWIISNNRLDITDPAQPSLVISRPTDGSTSNPINYSGGGFELGVANTAGTWNISCVPSDVVFKAEGPSSMIIASENGNIKFLEGNVLIGKTSQINTAYVLDVNGKARVNELVVNTTGADFVFEPSYKLLSLKTLEGYIKFYHHLPNIQPAAEMQLNGISVGEFQAKLLQKTEELTLYIIDQSKKRENQEKIISLLSAQLGEQQKLLNQLQETVNKLTSKN